MFLASSESFRSLLAFLVGQIFILVYQNGAGRHYTIIMLWIRAPKRIFVGLNVLELAAYDTVICFSDGSVSRNKVFKELGMKVGQNTWNGLKRMDNERIARAEKSIQERG